MPEELPLHLAGIDADIADTDYLAVFPAAGFATQDSPLADQNADNHPPLRARVGRFRTYAGAFNAVDGATAGRVYSYDDALWFCLRDTNTPPDLNASLDWLQVARWGGNYRGEWSQTTNFGAGDIVQHRDTEMDYFIAVRGHTSGGDFDTDLDNGDWVRASFPSHFDVDDDALGINIAPAAIAHFMSYEDHDFAEHLLKLERYEDESLYAEFASDGSERGRIGYNHQHDAIEIAAAESGGIRLQQAVGATYRDIFAVRDNRLEPATHNTQDIGQANNQLRAGYFRQLTSARVFASETDRDTALPTPVEGQTCIVGNQMQVYGGSFWVDSQDTRERAVRFTELQDTPSSIGAPGYGVVANAAGDGLEFKFLNTGWVRDPSRDIALHSTINVLSMTRDVNGAGLALLVQGNQIYRIPFTNNRPSGPATIYKTISQDGLRGLIALGDYYYSTNNEYLIRVDSRNASATDIEYGWSGDHTTIYSVALNSTGDALVGIGHWSSAFYLHDITLTGHRSRGAIFSNSQAEVERITTEWDRYWYPIPDGEDDSGVAARGIANLEADTDLALNLHPDNTRIHGLAWFGNVLYVADNNDDKIYAYRWAGQHFDDVTSNSFGGGVSGSGGSLPDWVIIDGTEQSVGAPVFRTARIKHPGPDRTNYGSAFNQRGNHPDGDLIIGSEYETYAFDGLLHSDLLPAGVGLYNLGNRLSSQFGEINVKKVRTRVIEANIADGTPGGTADQTGLYINDATSVTGNLQGARTFINAAARNAAITNPITGQLTIAAGVLDYYENGEWHDIGGIHAGTHSDLSAVESHIIPAVSVTYNIGASNKRWSHVWGHELHAGSIEPDSSSSSAVLYLGRADNSRVALRGTFDGRSAQRRGFVTGASWTFHNRTTSAPGIVLSLTDDAGMVISAPRIQPQYVAELLAAYGSPSAGQVLRVDADGDMEWHFGNDFAVDVEARTFIAKTAGTLSNVAFGFDGNDNTGIYQPRTNTVGIVTAGELRLEIDQHGNLIPNAIDNTLPNIRLGSDTQSQRVEMYATLLNYQNIQQASSITRKFAVSDLSETDANQLHDIRIRNFQWRDRPEVRQIGVVREECPSGFRGVDGDAIDLGAIVYALVAEVQQLKRELDQVETQWSTFRRPAWREWPADTDQSRGIPPSGWNADGTRI